MGHPTTVNSVSSPFGYNAVLSVSVSGSGTIDNGQSLTLTATPSGGTQAYAYQWYANAGCSTTMTGKTTSTLTDSPTTTNTYCVQVTDSASLVATTNTATGTITVDNPTVSISSVSNTLIDAGQWTTFTASVSGGVGNYNLQLFNTTNAFKQNGLSNEIVVGASGTNTFSMLTAATGTFQFNVIAIDTGSSAGNFVFNSIPTSISVNAPLVVSIAPTSNTLPFGVQQTLTATVTPGQPPYTYDWTVANALGIAFSASYSGNAYTTNTFTFTALAAGTYNAYVVVIDTSSAGSTANSINSIITVNPPITCSFTTSVASIDFGTFYIGTNTIGTVNTVAVTDMGGTASNIFIYGGNWIGNLGDQYLPQNTIYNSIAQGFFVGPTLTTSLTDTYIPVNTLSPNSISLGTAIPASEPVGETFQQNIDILSSC